MRYDSIVHAPMAKAVIVLMILTYILSLYAGAPEEFHQRGREIREVSERSGYTPPASPPPTAPLGSPGGIAGPRSRTETNHQWPMKGIDMYHTNHQPLENRGVMEPTVKWDNNVNVLSWATVAGDFSPNIRGDTPEGKQHLVYVFNNNTRMEVHVVDGATGRDAWVLDIEDINTSIVGDRITATPAIADFDRNGMTEIAIVTDNDIRNRGALYVFEPEIRYDRATGYSWDRENNSAKEKKFVYGHVGDTLEASPVLGDINNDGWTDVVLVMGMELVALDVAHGEVIFRYDRLVGTMASVPALYQYLPGDLRCVLTTKDDSELNIYMVDHEGNTAWNKTLQLSGTTNAPATFLPSPAIGEIKLTQEGKEIVILSPYENGNGRVRVFSRDGSELWGLAAEVEGQLDASPALADVDGDSLSEIAVVSWKRGPPARIESHAYLIDDSGKRIWEIVENETTVLEATIVAPVFAMVDPDLTPDVVFATTNTVISVEGLTGKKIWELDPGGGIITSSLAAGVFDNDGFLDITAEGFLISNREVDLTLNGDDISLTSPDVRKGVEVEIVAMIHNRGEDSSRAVDVRFYENTTLIGNTTVDLIPGEDTRQATMSWTPGEVGYKEITVVVDGNDTILETAEDNNRASVFVEVRKALPDLAVVRIDLKRHDKVKTDNENIHLVEGEESYINITVTNTGYRKAPRCPITISKDGAEVVKTMDLGALDRGEERDFEFPHSFAEGIVLLNVTLDRSETMEEENGSNNYWEERVTIIDSDPGGASYVIEGHIYTSEFEDASKAEVRVLNYATLEGLGVRAGEDGYYSVDLAKLEQGYTEGERIRVSANYRNESYTTEIYAYSEDKGIVKNILLVPPEKVFDVRFEESDRVTAPPGRTVTFRVNVSNQGDKTITIDLNEAVVTQANTSKTLNWNTRISNRTITLPVNESDIVLLSVEIPGETAIGTKARVRLTAAGPGNMERAITGHIIIDASSPFVLYAKEDNKSVMTPTREIQVNLKYFLANQGNFWDTYHIDVDAPRGFPVRYEEELRVDPGQTVGGNLTVTVRAGTLSTLHIDLTATSDTDRGVRHVNFTLIVGSPELSVGEGSLTFLPELPQLNDQLTITCTIYNNGSFDSPPFNVSLSAETPGGDAEERTLVEGIARGGRSTARFKLNLTDYGLYLFRISLDPDDDVPEGDEEDNRISRELDFRPDLTVKSAYFVPDPHSEEYLSSIKEGEEIYLKVRIYNPTYVHVVRDFNIVLYEPPYQPNLVYTKYIADEMIPGEEEAVFVIRPEFENLGPVTLNMEVRLDAEGNITETEEGNNTIGLTLTIEEGEERPEPGLLSGRGNAVKMAVILIVIILLGALYLYRRRRGAFFGKGGGRDGKDGGYVSIVEPLREGGGGSDDGGKGRGKTEVAKLRIENSGTKISGEDDEKGEGRGIDKNKKKGAREIPDDEGKGGDEESGEDAFIEELRKELGGQ